VRNDVDVVESLPAPDIGLGFEFVDDTRPTRGGESGIAQHCCFHLPACAERSHKVVKEGVYPPRVVSGGQEGCAEDNTADPLDQFCRV
jgi:hypothetical protein